jgi:hypothetical protein
MKFKKLITLNYFFLTNFLFLKKTNFLTIFFNHHKLGFFFFLEGIKWSHFYVAVINEKLRYLNTSDVATICS